MIGKKVERAGCRGLRLLLAVTLVLALSGLSSVAQADGYETPNLYSARHAGMGTTGISFADDPTAIFHNPAGMDTDFISLIANLSLTFAVIDGSPASNAESIESEVTIVPFFLLGANFKIIEGLTIGIAAFPVAAAGATYLYENSSGTELEDTLNLLFTEISPAISYELPGGVRLGAGYRITIATLSRYQGRADKDGNATAQFEAIGVNYAGFRAGIQWRLFEFVSAGIVYRHKIEMTATDESDVFFAGQPQDKVDAGLTLPSKLGFGVRGDYSGVGLAVDVEYGWHSQEKEETVDFGNGLELTQVYEWTDGWTVHAGTEWELPWVEGLFLRAGYIWDENTTPAAYPSQWGTPPDHSHSISAGAGYETGPMSVNVAWSNRFGDGTSTEEDQEDRRPCVTCGLPGDYAFTTNGAYVDFSWDF